MNSTGFTPKSSGFHFRGGRFHFLDKRLDQISGGELQIVLIARAIIQRTPIILPDEPTSALDLKNQSLVLSVLKEIAEQEKKTIVFVLSHLAQISFNWDLITIYNNGKQESKKHEKNNSFDVASYVGAYRM